ncbi:chitin deacetylase [Podochytrium sp. JEL0797]|nr:chitin deacetylase [Podochytrium sp. JEL0797]
MAILTHSAALFTLAALLTHSTHAQSFDFSWAPNSESGVAAPPVPAWTNYFTSMPYASFGSDIITCSGAATNVWGATFDDGPSENTPAVLNYFKSVNMHATFWVIGVNVLQYPDVLLQTYQAGHDIGLHTWSHPDLVTLSDDQIVAELVYASKVVYEVLGVLPSYFRPPYGSVNDNVREITKKMGLTPVMWAVDSEDWSYVGTGNMYLVKQAFQGWVNQGINNAISLEHDLFAETVAAIPDAMNVLIQSGRVIKPFHECIGVSSSYGNSAMQAFFASGQFEAGLGGGSVKPPSAAVSDWATCGPSVGSSVCASSGFICCIAPADLGSGKSTCRPNNAQNCAGTNPPPPPVTPTAAPGGATISDWATCGPSVGSSVCASSGFICCVAPADLGSGKSTCRPNNAQTSFGTDCAGTKPPPAVTTASVAPPIPTGAPGVAPIADWETCGPSVGTSVCATSGYVCCVAPGDAASQKTTCRPNNLSNCISVVGPPSPGNGGAIANWETCGSSVGSYTCASSGFTCCIASADLGSGKATCRSGG